MARDPIRGEGMLIAIGVLLLGSLAAAAFFGFRALSSAPASVIPTAKPSTVTTSTPAPAPEPLPAPAVTPEPPVPTPAPTVKAPAGPRLADRSGRQTAPQVRFGALTVSGRLPPDVVQRIVRQRSGRFRMCYEQALANNPQLKGRLTARFVIGRDGGTSNVANAGTDLPSTSMVSCVLSAFYGLSFPTPEGGIVTVVAPLDFSPS